MIYLLKMMLAHVLGDFVFQPNKWVKDKEAHKIASPYLYLHILIHGVLILILFGNPAFWPLALGVSLAHYCIDLIKLYGQKKTPGNRAVWFVLDQAIHLVVLALIACSYFHLSLSSFVSAFDPEAFWLYVTAVVMLTSVTGTCMQVLLAKWTLELEDGPDRSLLNAGKYIGYIERVLVFTFIIKGHWEAVGFLLAAKSIFRFGDLKESKDRKLTEYMLIGTLLSFGSALLFALLVSWLLGF